VGGQARAQEASAWTAETASTHANMKPLSAYEGNPCTTTARARAPVRHVVYNIQYCGRAGEQAEVRDNKRENCHLMTWTRQYTSRTGDHHVGEAPIIGHLDEDHAHEQSE